MGQRYSRMEDQKPRPWLACNLDFVKEKGVEPKIKKVSKLILIGQRGKQTGLTQTHHRRWAIFCNFF